MVLCPDERSFSQLAFKRNTGHRIKRKKRKLNPGFEMSSRSNLHREMNIFLKKTNGMFFFFDLATKDFYVLFMLLLLKKFGKFEPDDYLTDKISC